MGPSLRRNGKCGTGDSKKRQLLKFCYKTKQKMGAVAGTMLTHSFVSVGETVACLYANGIIQQREEK